MARLSHLTYEYKMAIEISQQKNSEDIYEYGTLLELLEKT